MVPTSAPVARLWCAVFAGYLAFGATLQTLPRWLHARFDAGPGTTGLAVGVAFAATAVGRPLAGRAGDGGRARFVVVLGGLLIATGALAQVVAPALVVVLAGRLLMGAGEAALFSGALPWVLAAAPLDRRGQVAGWFGLSMWSGLALGPVIAALVERNEGDQVTWAVIVGLGVLAAGLAALTSRQPGVLTGRLRPDGWREVLPRGAAIPGIALGLAAYGYGTISALLVLDLAAAGHGGANVGLAVFAAAFLLVRWAGSPAVDRLGAARVATADLVVQVSGLALVTASGTLPITLTGAALAGAGLSLIYPATVAITLARTRYTGAGGAVGATTSFWDLGILVAGLAGGLLADRAGYRTAFAVATAAGLAALSITLALKANVADD